MIDNMFQYRPEGLPGTAVNCEKDGHCWHEATDFGRTCCKCGKHMSSEDIAEGRINKTPKTELAEKE